MKKGNCVPAGIMMCMLVFLMLFMGSMNLAARGNQEGADTGADSAVSGTSPGEPVYGGVLKLGQNRDVAVFGYPAANGWGGATYYYDPVMETPLKLNPDGSLSGKLATDWGYINDEKTELKLTVRQNVRFHDGSVLNAEVMKWNLENAMEEQKTAAKRFDHIDVTGEYELIIYLTEPDYTLVSYLASNTAFYMISKEAVEKNGVDWANSHPVGTGPFKLVSWEQDVKTVFEKNDDYWQEGLPYLDGVEIYTMPEEMVLVASMQSGDIDVLFDPVAQSVETLKATNKFNIVGSRLPATLNQLFPSSGTPGDILENKDLRLAVWHAVDFKGIAEMFLGEYEDYAYQLVSEESPGFNPEIPEHQYDPDLAKEYLKKAGYPDGFECDLYIKNLGLFPDIATTIQAYCAEVGIKLNVVMKDSTGYDALIIKEGWKNGFLLMNYNPTLPTMSRIYDFGFQRSTIKIFYRSMALNDAIYDAVDKVVHQEPSGEQFYKDFQEMNRLWIEEAATIPIYFKKTVCVKNPKVHDDGNGDLPTGIWTPATAWMEK